VAKWWDNRWIELACRLLLGGVFVYASLDKILHPTQFAKVVYNYQMLPLPLSNLLAMILPWLELFAGLALIIGVLLAESALLLSGLLAVFIFALSLNLYRGIDVDCGCLSLSGGRSIGILTVVEDVCLLLAALVVFRRSVSEEGVDEAA
jgi:hypothetical protein